MSSPLASIEPRETTPRRWLSIVGIGEDGTAGLSAAAKRLIETAELVVGGARHLALAGNLIRGEKLAWPSPLDGAFPEILRRRGRSVAVLATGDPFNFGIGRQLAALVPADEILCLPQPSAFSLAAARMGWSLPETVCVTLHGRAIEGILRHLQPGARIIALAWDGTTAGKLAALLAARGFGGSRLSVLEAMGGPRERVRSDAADGFGLSGIEALNTLAIEVVGGGDNKVIGFAPGLDDDLFENDGQLTKREVRALTLSSLAPRRGELLWDIGLGAGSVAIEWLLCDTSLSAIGIEERSERAERAMRNAFALGAPDVRVVTGRAPDALTGLPAPDAVFVGGGLSDEGVFDRAWAALKPGGRLVSNAVTLESEARLADLFARHGGELTRIAVSRAEPVGGMHGWRPAMPVTHWRVRKS